jgi:hypothetical protein
MFRAGNYEDVVAMKLEQEQKKMMLMPEQKTFQNDVDESEYETDDEYVYDLNQTFPLRNHKKVILQGDDLTCGMRALQNLFYRGFVNREEMDNKSKFLETLTNGIPMYDKDLGFYSIEVLNAIVKDKGYHVQRIAIDKIKNEYFVPIVASTPLFKGYIVTIGNNNTRNDIKHYIAIQYIDGEYVMMDSLSGSSMSVPVDTLFQKRTDGCVYCSIDVSDNKPVVAVLAIGGSPFIEYFMMHQSWSDNSSLVSPKKLSCIIQESLEMNYNSNFANKNTNDGIIIKWLTSLQKRRSLPPDNYIGYFKNIINDQLQTKQILVKKGNLQTIVHCIDVGGMMKELKEMGWLKETQNAYLQQNNKTLFHKNGQLLNIDSDGTFNQYLIDVKKPLVIISDKLYTYEASVGGFYTFRSSVSGECVEKNHNAYSIRDNHGSVHVLYKSTVEDIKKFNNN